MLDNEKLKVQFILILRIFLLIIPFVILSILQIRISILHNIFLEQVLFFLNLFGINFKAYGYLILTENFAFTLIFDCTGWKQFYIFTALIFLPLKIKLSNRLKGLLFLIPLYIYNLFRSIISIYIGNISYFWFKIIHYLLWDLLFLVLIFIFWYWWYRCYRRN